MTVAEMRTLLMLGSEVPDAAVVDAYVIYLEGAVPGTEPITLAEARAQVRMTPSDPTDKDGLIEGLIPAARELVEGLTGLILTRRQIVQHAHSFSGLNFRAWPIISIDAVTYYDANGIERVLDALAYQIVPTARPVRLLTGAGMYWPSIRSVNNGITVVATAGFETPEDVPALLRRAMLMAIDYWFTNEIADGVPPGVASLCRLKKRHTL